MEYKYRLKKDDKWQMSIWPWNTSESMTASLLDGSCKMGHKIKTFEDHCRLSEGIICMATGKRIGKWTKQNRRAVISGKKESHGAKDHFTRGCPACDTPGIPIPRERPECKDLPPGLWCPKCNERFNSASIYFGKPGFAVAAGPSMDKNGHELKRVMGKYPIFAADAALKPLLAKGVRPDYVVGIEPDPLIMKSIDGVDTSDIILLALTTLHHGVRKAWKGQVLIFDTPSFGDERKKRDRELGDIGSAAGGGNVSTVMFCIMQSLMISPIIFVAHDFSFMKSYYPKDGPNAMAPIADELSTHDIYGNKVLTHQILYRYKQWTDMAVSTIRKESSLQRFINATEGGILGTTYIDPKRFIKSQAMYRRLKYRFKKLWQERRWPEYQECEQNAYVGPRLNCYEYMSLKEAIDKYCPKAKEQQ